MIEQAPELPKVSWPEIYDPDLELVELHPLYCKISKPVRLNKPGRELIYRSPTSAQIISEFGELPKNYYMKVKPFGWAGNHYHNKKVELFAPIGELPLIVFLEHIQTREKDLIILKEDDESDTYIQYLIPPMVAHFVINPSGIKVPYDVHSNMSETQALRSGDVIHFPINASAFMLPEEITLTPELQSLINSSQSLR